MVIIVYCDIVSVEVEIFFGLVEMVIVYGVLGDLGIVLGYVLLIIDLKLGFICLVKQGGEQEVYYIFGGFFEVQLNMVKVFVDIVVCVGDFDEVVVQEVLKVVEKVLQGKGVEFDYSVVVVCLVEVVVQLCIVQ